MKLRYHTTWHGNFGVLFVVGWTLISACSPAGAADPLESGFATPPDSARPWVYWFWMNGNITRDGTTADLEAMRDVGIGGCIIMHVKLGEINGTCHSSDGGDAMNHVERFRAVMDFQPVDRLPRWE